MGPFWTPILGPDWTPIDRLSYGDLSALVATRIGRQASNLLWELARDRLSLTDEAAFVDAVSDSLSAGAFDLVVLGDGIRLESVDAFVSTDEEAQLAWLVQTSDRLVSAFRPRLSALG
ncbi:hypothetical protein ASG52_24285 [Methylobacterium sp. Leaf456]|nr:hypothetical protein ASG52_24285 [Methylobacterium sp. Leaf456]